MSAGGLAGSVQVPVRECGRVLHGLPGAAQHLSVLRLSSEVHLPLGEGDVTSWECSVLNKAGGTVHSPLARESSQKRPGHAGARTLRRGSFLE